MNREIFRKANILILVLVAIACLRLIGCARSSKIISKPSKVDSESYIDLMRVCDDYNFDLYWDRYGRVAVLCRPDLRLRLRTGSKLALVNGRVERLDEPIRVVDGLIYVPKVSVTKFTGKPYLTPKRDIAVTPGTRKAHRIKTIVIDPGHGGKDPGAIGKNGLKEKNITLDIARKLRDILNKNGLEAVITREDDSFVSLWQRADIANERNADFFISIHANASRVRGVNGFEVYYLSDKIDDSARAIMEAENSSIEFEEVPEEVFSTDLQAILWDMLYAENRAESVELARWVCRSFDESLPIRNRGVKGACFYVLRGVKMPGVLVETGFISNPEEEARLKSGLYRQMLAESIASGILAYKKQFELANGFTE